MTSLEAHFSFPAERYSWLTCLAEPIQTKNLLDLIDSLRRRKIVSPHDLHPARNSIPYTVMCCMFFRITAKYLVETRSSAIPRSTPQTSSNMQMNLMETDTSGAIISSSMSREHIETLMVRSWYVEAADVLGITNPGILTTIANVHLKEESEYQYHHSQVPSRIPMPLRNPY